jgi:hypothetical protein
MAGRQAQASQSPASALTTDRLRLFHVGAVMLHGTPPTHRVVFRHKQLLQEQLADGPKPGVLVEAAALAAEIPERSLIAAADSLGVRTQRGQWWLLG